MKLAFHLYDNLAVGFTQDNRWALTLCKPGFCYSVGRRVDDGIVFAEYEIAEFIEGEAFEKDAQLISYHIQEDMVMGWLASDSGEMVFPINRNVFETIAEPARIRCGRPAFESGQKFTCRTTTVVA